MKSARFMITTKFSLLIRIIICSLQINPEIYLRLKTKLTSNNCMSTGEPELCPMCKKGYLRPIGKASAIGTDEPFTPTVHMRELQCDNCGHTQKAASLTE